MSQYIPVADCASLPPGKGRTVEVGEKTLAIYNHDGTYFAFDDACPHRGAPLGAGFLEDGKIFCPLHGWAFDVRSGACQHNPNILLQSYPTRVINGEVEVKI